MSTRLFAVVVLLCSVSVHALVYPPAYNEVQGDYPKQWFEQKMDHFDPDNKDTFQQKFYVNDDYCLRPDIIILYINGEGPVSGPPSGNNSEVAKLAQRYGCLIVTLEHRYYGESIPTPDLSTKNMRFLSSRQALHDLANFVQAFTVGDNSDFKWLVVGGSYSGALSAWYRVKFPELSEGAISSSGVVNAILDFVEFDEQIAVSAGSDCAEALRQSTQAVQKLIEDPQERTNMMSRMGVPTDHHMEDGDFYYLLADSQVFPVQYGDQDAICVPLVNAMKNGSSVLDAYVRYYNDFFVAKMMPSGYKSYDTYYQKNITVGELSATRSWWWQKCTELAYFQNAPKAGSIRSEHVNMEYHLQHCTEVFGEHLVPNTTATNEYYGGDHPNVENVFFVNGSQDPWQRASIRKALSKTDPALIVTCHNCGHCVDLGGCPGGCGGTVLEDARAKIQSYTDQWLGWGN